MVEEILTLQHCNVPRVLQCCNLKKKKLNQRGSPVHSNSEQRICTIQIQKDRASPRTLKQKAGDFINKDVKIGIYLNKEESNKLKEIAKLCHLTQIETLRRLALGIPLCELPTEDFFKVLNQFYGVYNSFKSLSMHDESLGKTLSEIEILILNLQEKYQLGGANIGNN